MIILAMRGQGKNLVFDRNSIVKKRKFEKFNQNSWYIPQKNAENIYNMGSAMRISAKMIFFVNIFNFLEMFYDPQKFRI